MTNLTDTQRLILNHAAARKSGAVLPLPDTFKLKGGALKATLATLTMRGLIEERQNRKKPSFHITANGRAAIRCQEPKGSGRAGRAMGGTFSGRTAIAREPEVPRKQPRASATGRRVGRVDTQSEKAAGADGARAQM